MSDDNQQSVIANAGAIIQRFGGIRPMSKATGIPVTTIQGWKKRDIIPATRREEIRRHAHDNNIVLDDLLDAAEQTPAEDHRAGQEPAAGQNKAQDTSGETLDLNKAQAVHSTDAMPGDAESGRSKQAEARERSPKHSSAQSAFMGQMALIVTTVLFAVLVLGAFMFWPDLKKVPEQNKRITKLERNVEQVDREVEKVDRKVTQVKDKQGYLDSLVPDDLKSQLAGLRGRTRQLSQKTGQLSRKIAGLSADDVTSYAKDAISEQNFQKLQRRVSKLEQQMRQYAEESGMSGISNFMMRLNAMQNAESGRKQLAKATSQLHNLLQSAGWDTDKLKKALILSKGEDDALGNTLNGVDNENMKAAAMLMAFSNMRSALSRDRASFEQDLELMRRLVDTDNKELDKAINRLAPEAKNGVLTASGLSREFRSFAGEIAAASLQGRDVSIGDKARARLSEIVTVKKDGQTITGTKEQKLVAEAKHKLDEGDVNGAIQTLRQLDGKPAKKARPFLKKAEATAMAEKLKKMLGNAVMQKLGGETELQAPMSVDVP